MFSSFSFSFIRLSSQVCGCALSRLGLLGFAGTPTIPLLTLTHQNTETTTRFSSFCIVDICPKVLFIPNHTGGNPTRIPSIIPVIISIFSFNILNTERKKTVSWPSKMLKWKIDFNKGRNLTFTTHFWTTATTPTDFNPTSCKSTIGGNSTALQGMEVGHPAKPLQNCHVLFWPSRLA